MKQYRIITHRGSVHVEKKWTFLWWWGGWDYVNSSNYGSQSYPREFINVETAEAYIDGQLAQQAINSQPRVIIPYPAP